MLNFYSSSSNIVDSKRAMIECLKNALGSIVPECSLIILHTTMGHNFQELLEGARELCPKARIAGCTGSGVIGKDGPNDTMRALAVMAITGPEDEFAVVGLDSVEGLDPYNAGRKIGEDLKKANSRIHAIHFMSTMKDLMPVDKAIDGIESVLGSDLPIFGGFAFDNMKFVDDYQFLDDTIIERGAVAVGFADPTLEYITGANHGFKIIGDPFTVTKSKLNIIYEVNGKPAWKAFTEGIGLTETADPVKEVGMVVVARRLQEEFQQAYGSPYIALGALVRQLRGNDDSVYVPVVCKEGTELWLTTRDEDKIFNGVDRLTDQLNKQAHGRIPVAVFHTDCAARGKYQFNHILKRDLIKKIQKPLCKGTDVPWLGFYAASEYCMVGGKNMPHGFTTSLSAIYRKEKEVEENNG